MKLTNLIKKLSALSACLLISSVTFASDSYFEVGKSYLYTPRMDLVMKGTVVKVTDQEVVFTNRYILKASKASALIKNNDAKSANIKSLAILEYLKSKNKDALLEASPLKDYETSYSRSEMTATKLD